VSPLGHACGGKSGAVVEVFTPLDPRGVACELQVALLEALLGEIVGLLAQSVGVAAPMVSNHVPSHILL